MRNSIVSARGAHRAQAGRVLMPFRVPPHRTTTLNLQALFPFVVESGLGPCGVYVGRQSGSSTSFVFDPWMQYARGVLTNPNMLLAGVIGRGKSALAKTLALRLSAFGVRIYVPGDPKGEWAAIGRALGVEPLALGRGMSTRLNPLDPGPRPDGIDNDEWGREVGARRHALLAALAETAMDRRLLPVERSALLTGLEAAARRNATPTLPDVVWALLSPTDTDARELGMTTDQLVTESRSVALELRRLVVGSTLRSIPDSGGTRWRVTGHPPGEVVDRSGAVDGQGYDQLRGTRPAVVARLHRPAPLDDVAVVGGQHAARRYPASRRAHLAKNHTWIRAK